MLSSDTWLVCSFAGCRARTRGDAADKRKKPEWPLAGFPASPPRSRSSADASRWKASPLSAMLVGSACCFRRTPSR
eukprot:7061022-Prymnesium_polylepis.1